MAIPKEPRQLMINIMYLVLTALLALNVSAEIFNAFKVVNHGLEESTASYVEANNKLPDAIKTAAKAKPEYQVYADRVDSVALLGDQFQEYVEGIIEHMIDESGDNNGTVDDGDYAIINGVKTLRGYKNYDVTTRYLVGDGNVAGKGEELKQKIIDYNKAFLSLIDPDDREKQAKNITLVVDDETWKLNENNKPKSWAQFNFSHMPLQATLPILNKFVNDARSSEGVVLNYLLGKTGNTQEYVLDKFVVISAPKKAYVIKGEKYETELSLGASASDNSNTKITLRVNGQAIPVKDGVGKWTTNASAVGVKNYNVTASVFNPVTNKTEEFKKTFEYEVGERSITVSATKMNVFYIGVDNPVAVSAAGVPSAQVKVSMGGSGGCSINRNGDGTYTVKCTQQTPKGSYAKVNVSAPGVTASSDFRVKRIPDPVAKLGLKDGGSMGTGEFKIQSVVVADLPSFDFDTKCNIQGFTLTKVAKRSDPVSAPNGGGKISGEAAALMNSAKPGDVYFFENVKARCPGDAATRKINEMVFKIK